MTVKGVTMDVGGMLLAATGLAILLNVKGAANALWRFWAREGTWRFWEGDPIGFSPDPLFLRLWFGILGAQGLYRPSAPLVRIEDLAAWHRFQVAAR